MQVPITLLIRLFLAPLLVLVTAAMLWATPERGWHITWLLVVDFFDRHPWLYVHASYLTGIGYAVLVAFLTHH